MATLDYVDDEWLLGILNHKDHLWLMQGRPKGAVVSNLRDALQRAHELSAAGGTVISISRLRGGDVKIFPIQIYRLWKVADRSDGSLLITLSSPERSLRSLSKAVNALPPSLRPQDRKSLDRRLSRSLSGVAEGTLGVIFPRLIAKLRGRHR